MTLFPVQVPENDWCRRIAKVCDSKLGNSLSYPSIVSTSLTDTRQISFNISDKDRCTDSTELFSHRVNRDRRAGTRRPRNQPMPVSQLWQQELIGLAFGNEHGIWHVRES